MLTQLPTKNQNKRDKGEKEKLQPPPSLIPVNML